MYLSLLYKGMPRSAQYVKNGIRGVKARSTYSVQREDLYWESGAGAGWGLFDIEPHRFQGSVLWHCPCGLSPHRFPNLRAKCTCTVSRAMISVSYLQNNTNHNMLPKIPYVCINLPTATAGLEVAGRCIRAVTLYCPGCHQR